MGEVYRARDAKLEREIALKILPPDLATNSESLRRFEHEARAASALSHPNIVTIFETGQLGSLAWIAMELVDGEDLRAAALREPFTVKKALRVAVKIAEGLAAAHDRGIVHRDLKPENVMISRDGFVKVLDFGLAKQIRAIADSESTLPHTVPGAVFGTVAYMSPEQASGREMDYRTDQFSLGVILYEMLTKHRPFDRATKAESMAAIIRDQPPPASTLAPAIPPELDRLIQRCLAKDPVDRYASTRDLARDLREIRDNLTAPLYDSHGSGATPMPRPRRARWIAIAAGLVFLAGAIATVWYRQSGTPGPEEITSVAVMPFADASSTLEGRVLADGFSQMIASRLGRSSGLRVAAPFEGVPISDRDDATTVARRSGAGAVVRGSIERDAQNIRVAYAIVDGRNGNEILSRSASRAAREIFSLEEAVARDLLEALGRSAPAATATSGELLDADEQTRYVEALGLMQRITDLRSVDRAVSILESLLGNARESAPVNALLARALLFKSMLSQRPALVEQAMIYGSRAITLDPGDVDAWVTFGMIQNATGKPVEALRSFERAISMRPDKHDALAGMASSYELLGRGDDAEATFRRAIAVRPDAYGLYQQLGSFYYSRGRYEEAVAQFRRATDLVPEARHAQSNLGAALQAMGRYDDALAAFRRSIEIEPSASGYSNLGTQLYYLGRYREAVDAYQKAAELAPTDCYSWANLGDARRWTDGEREKAPEAYRKAVAAGREALQINPNDALARGMIGVCLSRLGEPDEAQDEIRRALEIDPTNPFVLYHAALVALERKNLDSAATWLERSIAAGYPTGLATRDPELAPIRNLPAYRNAVAKRSSS